MSVNPASRRDDTLVHHSAKDIDSTRGGGAVPAAIPELVLALSRRDGDTSEIKDQTLTSKGGTDVLRPLTPPLR